MNDVSFELAPLSSPGDDGQGIAAVQVRGDIDITNAARLHDALARQAGHALIVDLSSVRYFDSAGFAVVDRLLSEARVAVVVAPGSVTRTAMSLMNLPFHDSVHAALASLRSA